MFGYPTVRSLATHLAGNGQEEQTAMDRSQDRAEARRQAMRRRRDGSRPGRRP
jgi:hypothetical protein